MPKTKNTNGTAKRKAALRYQSLGDMESALRAWAWELRGSKDPLVRKAQAASYPRMAQPVDHDAEIRERLEDLRALAHALRPVVTASSSPYVRGSVGRVATGLLPEVEKQVTWLETFARPVRRGRRGLGALRGEFAIRWQGGYTFPARSQSATEPMSALPPLRIAPARSPLALTFP